MTQLWGHEATVTTVEILRDGKTLATVDLAGVVLVWNLEPNMELATPCGLIRESLGSLTNSSLPGRPTSGNSRCGSVHAADRAV